MTLLVAPLRHVITMPDHGDHDAAILVITMRGMRTRDAGPLVWYHRGLSHSMAPRQDGVTCLRWRLWQHGFRLQPAWQSS